MAFCLKKCALRVVVMSFAGGNATTNCFRVLGHGKFCCNGESWTFMLFCCLLFISLFTSKETNNEYTVSYNQSLQIHLKSKKYFVK